MRRKFLPLLLLCLSTVACSPTIEETIEEAPAYEYSMIEDKLITKNEVFLQDSNFYYVYIFSKTCTHCGKIKNQIIPYSLGDDNFYYLEFSDQIKIVSNTAFTIGTYNPEDIAIRGTPTLLIIEDHFLSMNICGADNIANYLEF